MVEQAASSVPDRVRVACAAVAAPGAIGEDRGERDRGLRRRLCQPRPSCRRPTPRPHFAEGDREARAAFVICLDAINFGSGWWPEIRKRPGRSGYFTIAAGLTERFREAGPGRPAS